MLNNQLDVRINNFEGPMDLLIELIKDKQLNILDVNLFELATDYIRIIDLLKTSNMDLASEYLVMASSLILLKARMVLEDPNNEEEVKKEKENFLERLLEYHRYKLFSQELRAKELERKKYFAKPVSNFEEYQVEIDDSKLDGHLDPVQLIMVMRKMFERTNATKYREAKIQKMFLDPQQKRSEIIQILLDEENPDFEKIFSAPTVFHFSLTLSVLLDMASKGEVKLHQEKQFDKIYIQRGKIHG